jgi:hypothetical protein
MVINDEYYEISLPHNFVANLLVETIFSVASYRKNLCYIFTVAYDKSKTFQKSESRQFNKELRCGYFVPMQQRPNLTHVAETLPDFSF